METARCPGASGDSVKLASVAKRLIALDLLAADKCAANKHFEAYQAAGGKASPRLAPQPCPRPGLYRQTINIPGPLRSFGRMAAISERLDAGRGARRSGPQRSDQRLPGSHSNDALEQPSTSAGASFICRRRRSSKSSPARSKVIKTENCESANVGELLKVLGYRMRAAAGAKWCSKPSTPAAPFLTTDSGSAHRPGAGPAHQPVLQLRLSPDQVGVLYGPEYWLSAMEKSAEFIDAFLSDPSAVPIVPGPFEARSGHGGGASQSDAVQRQGRFPMSSISSAPCSRSATGRR